MSSLIEMGQKAKDAAVVLATLSTPAKNKALLASADALLAAKAEILAKNKADVDAAVEAGIKGAFIDRLTLTEARLADMAEGLRQVAKLDDPVGEVLSMKTLDNGLVIGQKRVPMGVIGIIFEARPNVAADAFGLCLKAGSAVILRGGKEAFQTNRAVISALRGALAAEGLPEDCVQMVPDTSRETANEMMRLSGYLDVLIPRGGAGLIRSVVMNATVPVIETGTGNCHVYVDATADLEMAKNILVNAKCQRPSVCNAAESLLVHKDVAEKFLPMAAEGLAPDHVAIHGCPRTMDILGTKFRARWSIRSMRPSSTSTALTPATRSASSPAIMMRRSDSLRKWTRRLSMSMRLRALPTALSSASALKSAFLLRSCTHAARWV